MRRYCSLISLIFCMGVMPVQAAPASPLAIEVTCDPGPQCINNGKRFYIRIAVVNRSDQDVQFTTKELRNTGAYLILRDRKTKMEDHWHASLGDGDFHNEFEVIRPGESFVINESVHPLNIEILRKAMNDLDVEVVVHGYWKYTGGERLSYKQRGHFKIIKTDNEAPQNTRKQQ
jgi:hypothetical protein